MTSLGDELCTQRADFEVLCDIHRIPERNYAYCHFRGPDGRVYAINESEVAWSDNRASPLSAPIGQGYLPLGAVPRMG